MTLFVCICTHNPNTKSHNRDTIQTQHREFYCAVRAWVVACCLMCICVYGMCACVEAGWPRVLSDYVRACMLWIHALLCPFTLSASSAVTATVRSLIPSIVSYSLGNLTFLFPLQSLLMHTAHTVQEPGPIHGHRPAGHSVPAPNPQPAEGAADDRAIQALQHTQGTLLF
jgi:hypothetical protein